MKQKHHKPRADLDDDETTAEITEARRYNDDIAQGLLDLDAALIDETDPELFSAWLDDALEVVVLSSRDGYAVRVEVLVTYGGPNTWVTRDGRNGDGRVNVKTYWGSDVASKNVWVHRLASLIDDYAEEMR